jgi:hypothetical protein
MKTQSIDTHPDVERVQVEILRKLTMEQRLQMAMGLSDAVMAQAHRAIRQANPRLSEEEAGLLFVEVHYGRDLADRAREYIRKRREAKAG